MKTGEKILRIGFIVVILAIGMFKYAEINPTPHTDKDPYMSTVESKNKNFKVYKENNNGEYELDNSSTLPSSGYSLNTTRSKCLDGNNNVVNANLAFSNGKISITSSKTVYCTLYFDIERGTLALTTDNGDSGLSTGDVVTVTKNGIPNQNFYVVSTDASETVLLAEYNLLVGDIIDRNNSTYTLNKTLSSSDSGYGLQSSIANAWVSGKTAQYVGVVPFSGTSYWDNSLCQFTGNVWNNCEAIGLKSPYNANGASYNGNPYPSIYNSSMSNNAPSLDYTSGYGTAQNNGYTIAYYVEKYINKLGVNGTGRLLTYEEEQSLASTNSSIVYNGQTYWLGSAYSEARIYFTLSNGSVNLVNFASDWYSGARPVIIVSTADIQTS